MEKKGEQKERNFKKKREKKGLLPYSVFQCFSFFKKKYKRPTLPMLAHIHRHFELQPVANTGCVIKSDYIIFWLKFKDKKKKKGCRV